MPEIVELPATVLASAETSTAKYGHQQLMSFAENCEKVIRTVKNS
jgi:hypothetical protein